MENRERVFRLKGYWRFGTKHRFDFGWYEVDRSYSGTLVDFGVSSSYFPTKHFGFGFGYDGYTIDVGIDKDSFNGAIEYTNRGFNAFLIGVF